MKTCPNCKLTITRRVKNACPGCKQTLIIHQGEYYLQAEKDAVIDLIKGLEGLIYHRDKISVSKTRDVIELKFSWDYVKRVRLFMESQGDMFGITVPVFLSGLWAFIVKNTWWYDHLTSLRMLSRQLGDLILNYWKEAKQEQQAKSKNIMKLQDFEGRVNVNYSVI